MTELATIEIFVAYEIDRRRKANAHDSVHDWCLVRATGAQRARLHAQHVPCRTR